MKKPIEKISFETLQNHACVEKKSYANENFFMTMSARQFGLKILNKGQTYRVEEGRLMRILSGRATCFINLQHFVLEPQMLFFISPGTIFEIEDYDKDFDHQAFSFIDQPQGSMFETCKVSYLSGDMWQLTDEYIRLLWNEVTQPVQSLASISSLQTALLARLHLLSDKESPVSYKNERLHRFLSLLNEHGLYERNIAFYAGKLCITPNHFGSVIKQASGFTVAQWINRYIIQQAKIQLKYTDLPIGEIAEKLHFADSSFFSKFFKKETGMTPGKYRKV